METDERGEPKPGVAAITLPAIMERINKLGEPLGPLLPPMRGAFSLLNLVEGYVSMCSLYAVCVQCEPAPLLLGAHLACRRRPTSPLPACASCGSPTTIPCALCPHSCLARRRSSSGWTSFTTCCATAPASTPSSSRARRFHVT